MQRKRKSLRIVIADDNNMVRYALCVALEAIDDFELVGQAANGNDAVEICRQSTPDILLVDLIMPVLSGVATINRIRHEMPNVCCIALTSFEEAVLVRDAMSAGAASFLIKNISIDLLGTAIWDAYEGRPKIALEALELVHEEAQRSSATPMVLPKRDVNILQHLMTRIPDDQTAAQLEISVDELRDQIGRLMIQFNAGSRGDLIVRAVQQRAIEPDN